MYETEDLYEILQLHPSAEPEVIEAAYRRLARKYHPDVNRSVEAAQTMKRLNRAYDVLRDPTRRADYDRQRAENYTVSSKPNRDDVPGYSRREKESNRPSASTPSTPEQRSDTASSTYSGNPVVVILALIALTTLGFVFANCVVLSI